MNATDFREALTDALYESMDDDLRDASSYEEAGVLTSNEGLVVTLEDGSEFQVTIVQSRRAR